MTPTHRDRHEGFGHKSRKNLWEVQTFIDEQLEEVDCPMLTQTAIDVAVEEVFVNFAGYAYDQDNEDVEVQVTLHENPLSVEITFTDNGRQYDPLAKTTLTSRFLIRSAKGGLGKKSMDNVSYEHKDGTNILTIKKKRARLKTLIKYQAGYPFHSEIGYPACFMKVIML